MENKKTVIIEELRNVSEKLGKTKFGTIVFFKNSSTPITRKDIEKEFGSFANAMLAADLSPRKWSKVTDEQLFEAYDGAVKKLGHYPLGHPGEDELSKVTKISGHTFRKRFNGLKNFLFEYKNWLLLKTISSKDFKKQILKTTEEARSLVEENEKIGYFDNKQRYAGRAAETLVVAELLFKGFNAQMLPVDEGIDVFATNATKNEIYLIQVKHAYYTDTSSRTISITESSLERNKKQNVYYIFVLEKGPKRNFLILPFQKIDELMRSGSTAYSKDSKKISLVISFQDEDSISVGKTDVSRYLDAWDVLL